MRGILAEAENWRDSPCSRPDALNKVAENELGSRKREVVMRKKESNGGLEKSYGDRRRKMDGT